MNSTANADEPDSNESAVRTQAERSSSTRRKICQATLDALFEVGHVQLSTALVAEKAQISRGALTHQFPTRNELLVAAARFLFDSWADLPPVEEAAPRDQLAIGELINALWKNIFSTPHFIASQELLLAARLDDELGTLLGEAINDWMTRRDLRVAILLGLDPQNDDDATFIRLIISVLRGVAVFQGFDKNPVVARKLVDLWIDIAEMYEDRRRDD